MSTTTYFFCREIRKLSCRYPSYLDQFRITRKSHLLVLIAELSYFRVVFVVVFYCSYTFRGGNFEYCNLLLKKKNTPTGELLKECLLRTMLLRTYSHKKPKTPEMSSFLGQRLAPRHLCHVLSLQTISWFKCMYDSLYSQSLIVGLWHQNVPRLVAAFKEMRQAVSSRWPLVH